MININARFLTKRLTGLERYALEMSHALEKIDVSIKFLSPLMKYYQIKNELNTLIQIGRFNNYFWEQVELPLYLKKNGNPFLINLINTAPIIYKNQLTVIHDLAFIYNPKWYTKEAALFFKFIVERSARASKKIITVSNFSKSEIINYLNIPSDKVEVIHSGIPKFILKYAGNEYKNDYGDYILTVSSIEPRKNLNNLVEAFRKLNRSDLKLIIVGITNPTVFSKVDLGSSEYKNVLTIGYVSDEMLVNLYKNAKLFIYISLYEGFGFPPVEAISCGCPTIVSNVSSLPEVCGNIADYCDPTDIVNIKESMEFALSKKTRLSNEQVEEFRNKYDWDNSAHHLLNLINGIN
jgi:glycosyltransferase involved in cell wall biosynthesis